jgi:hypothetical protein
VPHSPLAFPARFDHGAWQEDIARASGSAQAAARAARRRYERNGVPIDELRAVQDEGPDSTNLPQCVKVYLPPPAGRFGMVFEVVSVESRLRLEYIAFGVRHHPRDSNAPTVYQIAHSRLHSKSRTKPRRRKRSPPRRRGERPAR